MEKLLKILTKTFIISIAFWAVYYLAFSVYSKSFNFFNWDDVQRENLMGWITAIFTLAFTYSNFKFDEH